MSSLIEQLSERFQSAEPTKIEIPEWGKDGEPYVAYYDIWTLKDEDTVRHFIGDDNPEGFAAVVCKKLKDENGKKLFDEKGDRHRLMRNSEAHVIKRVAMQIMGTTISIEEAEGN